MITTVYKCDKCAKEFDSPEKVVSVVLLVNNTPVRTFQTGDPSPERRATIVAHLCTDTCLWPSVEKIRGEINGRVVFPKTGSLPQ